VEYLCEFSTGKTDWGVDGGERERQRETDRALDRNGSSVGQKWLLKKLNS
jgi:hypothetical protein